MHRTHLGAGAEMPHSRRGCHANFSGQPCHSLEIPLDECRSVPRNVRITCRKFLSPWDADRYECFFKLLRTRSSKTKVLKSQVGESIASCNRNYRFLICCCFFEFCCVLLYYCPKQSTYRVKAPSLAFRSSQLVVCVQWCSMFVSLTNRFQSYEDKMKTCYQETTFQAFHDFCLQKMTQRQPHRLGTWYRRWTQHNLKRFITPSS